MLEFWSFSTRPSGPLTYQTYNLTYIQVYDTYVYLAGVVAEGVEIREDQGSPVEEGVQVHGNNPPHAGAQTFELESSQELGQRANLSPDWSFIFRQPIRSQVSSLTPVLTLQLQLKSFNPCE